MTFLEKRCDGFLRQLVGNNNASIFMELFDLIRSQHGGVFMLGGLKSQFQFYMQKASNIKVYRSDMEEVAMSWLTHW